MKEKLRSKYCFKIHVLHEAFFWIPKIKTPIIFESFGKNGGFGIMWFKWILILRRPDSSRVIPSIIK